MKREIVCILVMMLLIATTTLSVLGTNNHHNDDTFTISTSFEMMDVYEEIEQSNDKILCVDKLIGKRQVKYWEHVVDGFTIKNDSILLHISIENNSILEYNNCWSSIEISLPDIQKSTFEPVKCYWKKSVLFPDENDCGPFYNFYKEQNYPVACWEVRFFNGNTILYDMNGSVIGWGLCCPLENGFALSGDGNDHYGDCWVEWRSSASRWFRPWCDNVESERFPTKGEVSEYVRDNDLHFFYELAHGDYSRFQCGREHDDYTDKYYSRYHLQSDMTDRQPMKFAFIGSCGGMDKTDEYSFSYEFRKGKMQGTVTIGYTHMPDYPGSFGDTLPWQEKMFSCMNAGWTIKKSFDEACAYSPVLSDYVVFVGDENLIVGNNPPCPPEKPIGSSFSLPNEMLYFNTTTFDPEGDSIYYLFDWNDGTDSGWLGPYNYGEHIVASHVWNNNGKYYVKVKAKDENNIESEYSDPLDVTITNPPIKPETPTGPSSGKPGTEYTFTTSTTDLDGDAVYYMWNWGDDNFSEWLYTNEASYTWKQEAKFNISVRAKDIYGAESDWSDPLSFSTPKNKVISTPFPIRFLEDYPHMFPLLRKLLGVE